MSRWVVRKRRHLNVGIFGAPGHGASTLTDALVAAAGREPGGSTSVPVRTTGPQGEARFFECCSGARPFVLMDMPGDAVLAERVIGVGHVDVLVVVVSAVNGVTADAEGLLVLARHANVGEVHVAITQTDAADPELTEVVELEVRDLLRRHGRQDATVTDTVRSLLPVLDAAPDPSRDTAGPFLLPVQRLVQHPEGGTAVTGVIRRGRIQVGQAVYAERTNRLRVLGLPGHAVLGIERLGRDAGHALAGDHVTVHLRPGLDPRWTTPIVTAYDTYPSRKRFTCRFTLDATAGPLVAGRMFIFEFGADFVGAGAVGMVEHVHHEPGPPVTEVALESWWTLTPGLDFRAREAHNVVGTGTVLAVAPGDPTSTHMPAEW
jgi:elongation factor Tu